MTSELLLQLWSVPLAVLPASAYLAAIWWLDRYDREPLALLGGAFLWGALGAVHLSLVLSNALGALVQPALAHEATLWTGTVLVAPLVEEPAKALALLLLVRSRHFDNVTDGFVYGAAIGLGFGMTENLFYFNSSIEYGLAGWMATVALRTGYSTLVHASATSVLGAGLALARHQRGLRRIVLAVGGLLAALGIHALWNGLALLGTSRALGYGLLNFLLFPLEFLTLFLVLQLCLLRERKLLLFELQEEVEGGILPAAHLPQFCLSVGRRPKEQLEDAIDRRAYVRLATRLAFAKDQVRRAADPKPLHREITELRSEIDRLLTEAGVVRTGSVLRHAPQTDPGETSG